MYVTEFGVQIVFMRFNFQPVSLPAVATNIEADKWSFSICSPLLLLAVPSASVVDVTAVAVVTVAVAA